jgi:hypothetical protein
VSRRGTNYNERLRQAARAEATDSLLREAGRSLAQAASAAHAQPCPCGHPWDEHDGDEGCLHGWGDPDMLTGCFCERS